MNRGSHQTTLFQTWASSLSQSEIKAKKPTGRQNTQDSEDALANSPEVNYGLTAEDPDEQDDQLLVAACEEEESLAAACAPSSPPPGDSDQSPYSSGVLPCADFPGCHNSSAQVWIYPTNYPVRDYQLQISEAALVQNTLVCLPTGMGKTFIASVVMYNFYRWYPFGKIVFMAPTRPLVAQQIEACYKVMGIPQTHMAELTGSTLARHRQEVWRTKRVFFLTPQVMVNDLSRNSCPARHVKCVVIDEAHKALGNHAYCQVIRQLRSQTEQFRVLALSATPGGDVKSVQAVISNLLISHIELRSDDSPDIQAHSHQRSVDKVVVPLGEMLLGHQARYLEVLEKFMSRLVQNRVMVRKDLRNLTKYQVILARDQFRKNPPPHIRGVQQGMLEGDFALCISLYHGYELLIQMGLRSLFFYIQGVMDGSREMSRAKNELQRTPTFMNLYHDLEAMFMKPSLDGDEVFIYSHPKLKKLEEVVLQHFRTWADTDGADGRGKHTRVMIFSSFRESVQEIAAMLNHHAPLIRVMTFMGQASAGRGVKGFTQKEQLEVVQGFRQGGFNTLVSTCVGEEGLDIGEVDLIVCFDAQKNPTRLVQRMGRTGRKRQGRIVVILAEGREERTYNQSQNNKRSVYKSITGNKNSFHMYPNSPRMLPHGVYPKLHKMHITCGRFDPRESSRRSIRGRRSHSDRLSLLVHPQNQISDGFLSNSEYSEWSLNMSLQDGDAPPFLRLSTFPSICSEAQHQEEASSGRELCLWEWRHWQHKKLPVHVLDHSLRCQHFVEIMQLIDSMREEDEEDCLYERELLPFLHQRDVVKSDRKKIQIIKKSVKISELKQSHLFAFESLEKHTETSLTAGSVSALTKKKETSLILSGREELPVDTPLVSEASPIFPSIQHCPLPQFQDKCATQAKLDVTDEDVDFETMFCLRKWVSTPSCPVKLLSVQNEGLKTILNNVAKLLSQSPPSLPDELDTATATCPPPPLQLPAEVFPVSFNLVVDEDEEDLKDESDESPEGNKATDTWPGVLVQENPAVTTAAGSPTWEDIFKDEEPNSMTDSQDERDKLAEISVVSNSCKDLEAEEDLQSATAVKREAVDMEESLDLFGDDEPFLQMTFPDGCMQVGAVPPRRSLHDHSNADWMSHATNICSTTLAETKHRLRSEPQRKSSHLTAETRLHTSRQNSCRLHFKGSTKQEDTPPSLDSSHSIFSVNFDLGYTLEDSEEEAELLSSSSKEQNVSRMSKPAVFKSSTPCSRQASSVLASQSKRATGPVLSVHNVFPSPITSHGERWTLTEPIRCREERGTTEGSCLQLKSVCSHQTLQVTSDSEDEGVFQRRRPLHRFNPLSSPQVSKQPSEEDSPVVLNRKRSAVLHTFEETETEAVSDEDFQRESVISHRSTAQQAKRQRIKPMKAKLRVRGHHFIDDEAVLTENEDGTDLSSDEDDGQEQNQNLQDFVVDNTHVSEGLDDSQMQEVYLKSVRSPAEGRGKFKMFYKERPSVNVFSQVPELDETYTEDSFVVGSDVEDVASSEDEVPRVELPEESFVDGRKLYVTRRRLLLHRARAQRRPVQRGTNKRTRLLQIHDSSEEEAEGGPGGEQTGGSGGALDGNPMGADPSTLQQGSSSCSRQAEAWRLPEEEDQHRTRFLQKLEKQHTLSDQLDFVQPDTKILSRKDLQDTHGSSPICILVDSRCLGAGSDLLTFLRQQHAATVLVCSLDGGYFIVSCRMVVERLSRSELATGQNQRRLAERVNGMLGLFERVCLIVEKERCPTGDASRPFQRTRHYDSTLAMLVRSGVRLLWSSGVEESAGLLADLARLEQRKGWGITSPMEFRGQQGQQTLQWYSSLPSIHHAHVLQLSHHFRSINQLVNSSVDALQAGGCMSRSRAEQLLIFLRYSVDSLVLTRTTSGT